MTSHTHYQIKSRHTTWPSIPRAIQRKQPQKISASHEMEKKKKRGWCKAQPCELILTVIILSRAFLSFFSTSTSLPFSACTLHLLREGGGGIQNRAAHGGGDAAGKTKQREEEKLRVGGTGISAAEGASFATLAGAGAVGEGAAGLFCHVKKKFS